MAHGACVVGLDKLSTAEYCMNTEESGLIASQGREWGASYGIWLCFYVSLWYSRKVGVVRRLSSGQLVGD